MIKIGIAATRRFVFSKEDAHKYKDLVVEKLRGMGEIEIIDIESINSEGLLFDNDKDADKIIDLFKKEEVDAVFFPHTNFGTENTVCRVAKGVGKPVLLWGPRDEDPLEDGTRLRDTQCGLFATGKILRRFNVPFTYVPNTRLDDPIFERGLRNFIGAVSVVKAFKKLRILQISTRPAGFWTMMVNEGELLEKFGIEIHPITLVDIKNKTDELFVSKDKEVASTVEKIVNKLDTSSIKKEDIRKIASLKVAMKLLATENGCSAIAIQCWSALQDSMHLMPCLANALLTDEYIPVTCETDIHGAITSIMTQEAAMRQTPTFFADLTVRHTSNDNGELLFHCGNFPVSLGCEGCNAKASNHFLFEDHAPGTHEVKIKGGDMTIVRFDGDHGEYKLFMGHAKGIEGKYTRGSYVWIEVDNWLRWERKLVEGPYVHHCVGIHSDIIPVLYEATKYLPGIELDLVDTDEESIIDWLNGGLAKWK
ncbi:MAG: L-fucose/L-arabinose isomerase family protein [Clostridiales bacterium]